MMLVCVMWALKWTTVAEAGVYYVCNIFVYYIIDTIAYLNKGTSLPRVHNYSAAIFILACGGTNGD